MLRTALSAVHSTSSSSASNFSTADHDFLAATAFRKRSTTATRRWPRDTGIPPGPPGCRISNTAASTTAAVGCLTRLTNPPSLYHTSVSARGAGTKTEMMALKERTTIEDPQRPALTE